MIATRDTALYSAIGNLGGFVAPNLQGLAERVVGSPEAGMLSLAVAGLIGAALLLAFKSASAQSTDSIDSAAPLGTKRPSH
jgi:MFS-type transporter involved in bile tolerance (Atg22 family)